MLSDDITYECPCCGQPTQKKFLLDPHTRTVAYKGSKAVLTNQQFMIVQALADAYPKSLKHTTLVNILEPEQNGRELDDPQKYIQVIISYARSALKPVNLQIRNIRNVGYRLEEVMDLSGDDSISVLSKRGVGTAWTEEHLSKAADLLNRKYSIYQIAAILRMPYRTVRTKLYKEGLLNEQTS